MEISSKEFKYTIFLSERVKQLEKYILQKGLEIPDPVIPQPETPELFKRKNGVKKEEEKGKIDEVEDFRKKVSNFKKKLTPPDELVTEPRSPVRDLDSGDENEYFSQSLPEIRNENEGFFQKRQIKEAGKEKKQPIELSREKRTNRRERRNYDSPLIAPPPDYSPVVVRDDGGRNTLGPEDTTEEENEEGEEEEEMDEVSVGTALERDFIEPTNVKYFEKIRERVLETPVKDGAKQVIIHDIVGRFFTSLDEDNDFYRQYLGWKKIMYPEKKKKKEKDGRGKDVFINFVQNLEPKKEMKNYEEKVVGGVNMAFVSGNDSKKNSKKKRRGKAPKSRKGGGGGGKKRKTRKKKKK